MVRGMLGSAIWTRQKKGRARIQGERRKTQRNARPRAGVRPGGSPRLVPRGMPSLGQTLACDGQKLKTLEISAGFAGSQRPRTQTPSSPSPPPPDIAIAKAAAAATATTAATRGKFRATPSRTQKRRPSSPPRPPSAPTHRVHEVHERHVSHRRGEEVGPHVHHVPDQ